MFDFEAIRLKTTEARTATDKDVVPDNDQQIADLIEAKFDCHRQQTRSLVELILGRALPEASHEREMAKRPAIGTLIVFKRQTVLVVARDVDGDRRFVTSAGRDCVGDDSYITADDTWHYASDEQIYRFIDRFTANE